MTTVSGIIAELGNPTLLAQRLDPPISRQTVYAWRRRNNIPITYWPRLIKVSGGKITEADLLRINLQVPGAAS